MLVFAESVGLMCHMAHERNVTRVQARDAKARRLGRGLSSLMNVDAGGAGPTGGDAGDNAGSGDLLTVKVTLIDPNPRQPRTRFDEASLAELAASIRQNGLIQPIVVREAGEGRYELVVGERRLRAAKLARVDELPVIVRPATLAEQAEVALVENVHREDLNPIDRAQAYAALLDHLGVTQAELADRLGEDRSRIAHHLRLLALDAAVQERVRDGDLPLGHAKVLAGVEDAGEQRRLAELVQSQQLSVRNLERLIASGSAPTARRTEAGSEEAETTRRRHLDKLAEAFGRRLGSRCTIDPAGRNGCRVTLHLRDVDDFDRLVSHLNVELD